MIWVAVLAPLLMLAFAFWLLRAIDNYRDDENHR